MYKISSFIIYYANDTGIIFIGHNEGWKQKVNIGHKNNQKFVQIPYNKLISMIRYRTEELGISTIVINELYTDKASFPDNETIEHHNNYAGKRVSRDLFKISDETIINADENAAYNMIRKAIPVSLENGIERVGLHPGSLSIRQMITSKGVC